MDTSLQLNQPNSRLADIQQAHDKDLDLILCQLKNRSEKAPHSAITSLHIDKD